MSWISNYGYRLIEIRVDGKRKLVLEHRYLMEQHLGRTLDKTEIVHHINGDKLDNRLENLEVMPWGEHSKHHTHGIKRAYIPRPDFIPWNKGKRTPRIPKIRQSKEVWMRVCVFCGTSFTRAAKYIRYREKHGHQVVCSKRCRARLARQKQQS